MPDLHFLALDCPRLTDEALAHIAHRDELYQLVLKCPLLTDGALPRIATLPKLGFLELNCPRVTASGIRQLEPLEHLEGARSYRDLDNWDAVRSLRYPSTIDMADAPLMDVFDYLADFYNDVPFHTDDVPEAKGMAQVTVTPESPSPGV